MMNVAVHPDHRRRGIAEALILALSEDLKAGGNQCLTLEVRASNAPAIALYENLGFRQVGLRKNYYHKPKEDALILRKEWKI
jgi:ribosomal-protein-alanine N-acetyltransferase